MQDLSTLYDLSDAKRLRDLKFASFTTKQAAQLVGVTMRQFMLVCEYWDRKHPGYGSPREWSIAEIVDAGMRARLLQAGLRRKAIDALIGPPEWD